MASMAPARPCWRMRWRRSSRRAGRPAIRASVDDFHNPRSLRYARGKYSPDGFFLDSYDYDMFRRLLLDPLGPDGSGRYVARYFDHRTDKRVEAGAQQAPPSAALIVDGIFLHRPELRSHWDLSIFLKVDFKISVPRGAARDQTPEAIDPDAPAYQRYVGGQQRYLAECAPERVGRHRDRLQRSDGAEGVEVERLYAACPLRSVMPGASPLSGFCGSRL